MKTLKAVWTVFREEPLRWIVVTVMASSLIGIGVCWIFSLDASLWWMLAILSTIAGIGLDDGGDPYDPPYDPYP